MMKVKVSGLCEVKDEDGCDWDGDVNDCVHLDADGERFAEYCDHLDGIKSSDAHFEVRGGELYIVVEYECDGYLSAKQLEALSEYTQGQWSDGIGECFEQFPQYVAGDRCYISMWHRGQQVYLELN